MSSMKQFIRDIVGEVAWNEVTHGDEGLTCDEATKILYDILVKKKFKKERYVRYKRV